MAADRADDAGTSPDEPPDGPARNAIPGRAARAETRGREEYYLSLREKVAAGQQSAAAQEQARTGNWDEIAELSRWMWTEYRRKWPPGDRPAATSPLDSPTGDRVDAECDRVAEREREKISPALRDVEAQDPDRHLIGFEHRLKGRDRIKEKVCGTIRDFDRSPEEAVALVRDTIRYTFQYQETRYAQGVRADVERMQERGFELDKLKNSWSGEQYRGINSQWIDPPTGQRFELQFHTPISFEAKQLTHGAYERLRTQEADKFEELVLEAFQKKVTMAVPVPPGALDIPDHPERRENAG